MSNPRLRLVPGARSSAGGGRGSERLSPEQLRRLVLPVQRLLTRYTPPAQFRAAILALDYVIELWDQYLVALDEPVPVRVHEAVGAARAGVAEWLRRDSPAGERSAVFAAVKEAHIFVAGRKERESEPARGVCVAALALVAAAIEDSRPDPTDMELRLGKVVFMCAVVHNQAFPQRRPFAEAWVESLEDIESESSIQ